MAAYERGWRSPGTDSLRELFTEDATYRMSPYAEVVRGHAAIGELWERERQGADEAFEMSHEIVAVDGDTGVVRVDVQYGKPRPAEYRDLWIVKLGADGRCHEFEEWPYWPGQPIDPEGGRR